MSGFYSSACKYYFVVLNAGIIDSGGSSTIDVSWVDSTTVLVRVVEQKHLL